MTLAGAEARRPPSRMRIVSVQIFRPAPTGNASTSTSPSRPSAASGCGERTIVRDGWRSASPERTSSAASTHSGGTHAVCVITLVRWYGASAPGATRRSAIASSISRIVPSVTATEAPLAVPTPGNRRPGSPERSMPPPGPPVSVQQLVRGHRPPVSRGVVRERRAVARPRGHDRIHERPLLLHLVDPREQGRVTEHRVEDQTLVSLRQARPECAAVEKVHVHRTDRHPL